MKRSISRSTDPKTGLTTIWCTKARALDAGSEARIEWGEGVLLGYQHERPGHEREGWHCVGFVAAHRTGPRIPVLAEAARETVRVREV